MRQVSLVDLHCDAIPNLVLVKIPITRLYANYFFLPKPPSNVFPDFPIATRNSQRYILADAMRISKAHDFLVLALNMRASTESINAPNSGSNAYMIGVSHLLLMLSLTASRDWTASKKM